MSDNDLIIRRLKRAHDNRRKTIFAGPLFQDSIDAIRELSARVAELEAENGRLRTALHDAICRPEGVVPETADEFYEPMRIVQAEVQRMGLYGSNEK